MTRISGDGRVTWQRILTQPVGDTNPVGRGVTPTPDGGLIQFGVHFLERIEADGGVSWSLLLPDDHAIRDVAALPSGELRVAVDLGPNDEVGLLALAPDGTGCVPTLPFEPRIADPPLPVTEPLAVDARAAETASWDRVIAPSRRPAWVKTDCGPLVPPTGIAPTVRAARSADAVHLGWEAWPGAETYEVRRGSLAALAAGRYDHDTTLGGACVVEGTTWTDVAPTTPEGTYYLVGAANDAGRSGLGRDSASRPRPVGPCR